MIIFLCIAAPARTKANDVPGSYDDDLIIFVVVAIYLSTRSHGEQLTVQTSILTSGFCGTHPLHIQLEVHQCFTILLHCYNLLNLGYK